MHGRERERERERSGWKERERGRTERRSVINGTFDFRTHFPFLLALRPTIANFLPTPKIIASVCARARALKLAAKDAGGSIVRVASNDRSIVSSRRDVRDFRGKGSRSCVLVYPSRAGRKIKASPSISKDIYVVRRRRPPSPCLLSPS